MDRMPSFPSGHLTAAERRRRRREPMENPPRDDRLSCGAHRNLIQTGSNPDTEAALMSTVLETAYILKITGSCLVDLFRLILTTWLRIVFYPPRLFMGALIFEIMVPLLTRLSEAWARVVGFLPYRLARHLSWCPSSQADLEAAEASILSCIKTPYFGQYVHLGQLWGTKDIDIWTIALNANSEKTPLVLIHGFGLGLVQWVLNFDALAAQRPVYALDLPGFGRSSRVFFDSEPQTVELQYIECLEAWRQKVGLKKFILVGHNFGGFVASSYALQYPNPVARLILVDPWGFPERQLTHSSHLELPGWVHHVCHFITYFNALAVIRFSGRFGPDLIRKLRQDITSNFSVLVKDPDALPAYIYHCNVQEPTGEASKKVLTGPDGFAKYPMIHRIGDLSPSIPITYIYGSRSMVDKQPGRQIYYMRLNSEVTVESIHGGGVHVYADKPDHFNQIVNQAAQKTDEALNPPKKESEPLPLELGH